MDFLELYRECRLCPRKCGVNRLEQGPGARAGFCGEGHQPRIAYLGPHFGEEPPISGDRGSGTIFFSGCTLQCPYCQNHQISRGGIGNPVDIDDLVVMAVDMVRRDRVHNINLVTPDHFFPHVFQFVSALREQGCLLPVVYNLSGYQSLSMLRKAEPYADIYLPDYKYGDADLCLRLSRCSDYPKVALEAICEMVRQKGFLNVFEKGDTVAGRGVLVRHLILPSMVENSIQALTALFLEFGPGLPLSLMSQYTPTVPSKIEGLNRSVTRTEFEQVYSHALDLGFENLFVQFPGQDKSDPAQVSPFLPDFRLEQPFSPKNPPN